MIDRKPSSWLIPGVLFVGLAFMVLLTFQPVFAGDRQDGLKMMNESGSQSTLYKSQASSPLVEVDPACTVDTTNAISYWPLNETTGTTFDDVLTGSHDGECFGDSCPMPTSGTNAGGQLFNSIDEDEIIVPTSTDFDFILTDNFSAGIWVKTTQDCTGNKVYIGRYENLITEGRWWLGCEQVGDIGVARFHMRDSNKDLQFARGTTQINDGKWHYLTGVWDGTNTMLYVDGSLEDSDNTPGFSGNFISTEPLTIGGYDNQYYVDGVLDEAVIFSTALSDTAIGNYLDTCNFNVEMIQPDDQENYEGDTVSLQIEAGDPQGGDLTYTATGLPPGLNIDLNSGLISGTILEGSSNPSPYNVNVWATAPDLRFDTKQFFWTVSDVVYLPLIMKP